MKGKYANSAVHRREESLRTQLEQAHAALAEERAQHHAEAEALKDQLRKARSELLNEARRLASAELEKRLEEAQEERRRRGFSDDLMEHWQYRMDRFIMNACRYFSMTEGVNPLMALARIWTWLTDEKSYGAWQNPGTLTALGLPRDGWVVWALQRQHGGILRVKRDLRRHHDAALAVPLDQAEQEGHPDIHPDYNKWASYYNVDHRAALGLIDDDGQIEATIR